MRKKRSLNSACRSSDIEEIYSIKLSPTGGCYLLDSPDDWKKKIDWNSVIVYKNIKFSDLLLFMIEIIKKLAYSGDYRITFHARQEMDNDEISTKDLIYAITGETCKIIEDYPEDPRGPSHLLLTWIPEKEPVHICCAVHEETLVIITAYKPDSDLWHKGWRTRK